MSSRLRLRLLAIGAVAAIMLVALPAFAEGAAAEHHEGPNWLELGAALLNFAVYLGLMVRFGAKPAQAYFEARRARIASAIDEAKAASERAAEELAAARSRHAGLDAEVTRIAREAEALAVADAAKVVASAEAAASKMERDAEQLLEQESSAAESKYRHRLVDAALTQAREELARGVTPEMQHRLIDAGIERLSKQSSATHTTIG